MSGRLLTQARRGTSLLLFATIATGIYGIALSLRAILPTLEHAGAVAAGLTLDLVVVVPVLWYLIVIRRAGWPGITLVPVTIASLLAASRVLPAAHHGTLNVLEFAIAPLELAVLGYIGWKVTRAVRARRLMAPGASDPISTIRSVAGAIVPHRRLAAIVADELSVLYGGLFSWWARRPDEREHFTSHRRDAYVTVIVGLMLVMAVELFPVHVLLHRWSAVAAWIATALSLYGVVWLLGDFQAARLRPTRLHAGGIDVRVGLRWDVSIPFGDVVAIERVAGDPDVGGSRALKAVLFGAPTHRVTLRTPAVVRGLYGIEKRADTILFAVDDVARFEARLEFLAPSGRPGFKDGALDPMSRYPPGKDHPGGST